MKVLLFILFSFSSQADVVFNKVEDASFHRVSIKTACGSLGQYNQTIVKVLTERFVDCMGSKLDVHDFCAKKYPLRSEFLRATIDRDNQDIVCHFGSAVKFEYKCKKEGLGFCKNNMQKACESVQPFIARRLSLTAASMVGEKSPTVNCVFEKNAIINIKDL